jgi:integrase
VHDDVARRGTESETTRAHRLTIMRGSLSLPASRRHPNGCPRSPLLADRAPEICATGTQPRRGQTSGWTSTVRDADLGAALRLLYLAGLRAGELLRLTPANVDLDAGVLPIRHTKFDESRMVPIAPDLAQQLLRCRELAAKHFTGGAPETPFFPSPRGGRYSITDLRGAFHQTLKIAGIDRTTGNRHIRLHDLRHSMAVLRLLLWCEQNADLGAKLPLLATYLGHVGLASSQRYLQLTQDLMGEIITRRSNPFRLPDQRRWALMNEAAYTPHIALRTLSSVSRR